MHIFSVECRFASLIVNVDFCQKAIVDCRQKGPKSCDLHLIQKKWDKILKEIDSYSV